MLAYRLNAPGRLEDRPLELVEAPEPEPGRGEVRIRVRVNVLCRTDIHTVLGEIVPPEYPVVPGHQVVGVVDRLGPGTADGPSPSEGDRVGVAWLRSTCGKCPDCLRGDENLCENARFTGFRAIRRTRGGVWEKVGLYGFGSAAHIAIQILIHRGCEVYVVTRGERQREQARALGAKWVGGPEDEPPA